MRDWTIRVSYLWTRQATMNMLRRIHLSIIADQMLSDVIPERREYWAERLRGVDTHVRSLYYGSKVNNVNNDSTELPRGIQQ